MLRSDLKMYRIGCQTWDMTVTLRFNPRIFGTKGTKYIVWILSEFVSILATFNPNKWLKLNRKISLVWVWSLIWVEAAHLLTNWPIFVQNVCLKVLLKNIGHFDWNRLVKTSSNWLAIRLVKIGGQTIWIRICFFLFQRGFVVKTLLLGLNLLSRAKPKY